MSQSRAVPDETQLHKVLEESRKTRRELKLASLDLKELILALEKQTLLKRQQLLQKHMQS